MKVVTLSSGIEVKMSEFNRFNQACGVLKANKLRRALAALAIASQSSQPVELKFFSEFRQLGLVEKNGHVRNPIANIAKLALRQEGTKWVFVNPLMGRVSK